MTILDPLARSRVDGPSFSDEELAELDVGFQYKSPSAIISWAVEQFHPFLCLTASMNDAVLIDLAVAVEPSIEVVFIDTRYHFAETVPEPEQPLWQTDPVGCCSVAKVEQLDRALNGKLAWMSGLRRVEAVTRRNAPIISRDLRGLVKINPLAAWDDLDVAGYIAEHHVPFNPLLTDGYPSIGCQPCTTRVDAGDDPRAGRWAGLDKTECGIHV
jgi:phosphoadenosine phosphosulfate reductase